MGKCALKTFPLESDQSLPLELAKHNPYGRPEVVIGVCIDHEHRFSSKVASLDRKGGGDKIEDLMELLRNPPHVSKNTLFSNKLAQVAPQMVFVYHYEASR